MDKSSFSRRSQIESELIQLIVFIVIESIVFFLSSAILGNIFAGLAICVLLFDIVYIGRLEKPWLRFAIGFICVMVLVGYTIWPMLYAFLESGIPSFMYAIQGLVQPVQQFQNYLTPEYWSFSNRQSTVYEETTDDPGVPPHIDFSISNLEVKPSSEALFEQSFVVQMTTENSGDDDIKITRGFKSAMLEEISTSYACPCEILRTESGGWSRDTGDSDQTTLYYGCDNVFMNSEAEDPLNKRDWGEAIASHTPLAYSDCGDLGETTLRVGLPKNDYCTNVIYYPRHLELESETCQIESWAEADLHSKGILSVQVADDQYYFQQDLAPTTVPSVASTGAAIVSISAGEQPLLDIDPAMILTVGYENTRSGLVTDFYQVYFFVPQELGVCSDDDSYFECGDSDFCPTSSPGTWTEHQFVQDFIEECNALTTTDPDEPYDQLYRVCRLRSDDATPSKLDIFGDYILENGFGSVVCTLDLDDGFGGSIVDLEDQFRKSYLFRADSFYRYQVATVVDVHGVQIN